MAELRMQEEKEEALKCFDCDKEAEWVRCTQFAGDHPFCLEHAEKEKGFPLGSNSSEYWTTVEVYLETI